MMADRPIVECRHEIVLFVLKQPPVESDGKTSGYSNVGVMVAGHMAEMATGKSWEQLMQELVFDPLHLDSAGFGSPAQNDDDLNQPWGHRVQDEKILAPNRIDNAPAMGPAGTIHLSLADWCTFLKQFHADCSKRLITDETLERMLIPVGEENFAMGWVSLKRRWAKGKALTHSGSNTFWHATVWVAPRKNWTIIAAANCEGDGVHQLLDQLIGKQIDIATEAAGSTDDE
ncbi:MAG: serine hydrolase domain-containing protein [Pirellulaceae bacterium]